MDYPVYEGTERIGMLRIRREGLYAVFSAALPQCGGLKRLWLCGREAVFCLGLPEPRGSMLCLEKRLSRSACANLPRPILHAALSEAPPAPLLPSAPPAEPEPAGPREIRLFGQRFVVYRS